MTIYIVETTARASIREFWRVEADSEEAAREAVEDFGAYHLKCGGTPAEHLFDETLGDEDEREVDTIHPGDMLDGQLERRRMEAAAPAMLAALEGLLQWADADSLDNRRMSAIDEARAAIAMARGTPTDGPAHPIPAAPPVAISKERRDEWRREQGGGMTSAVGEYTPAEFWELLDAYEAAIAGGEG